jgi:hypothetical protein
MDDRIQNEQRMENATRIREGLDACRPGSSDLTSGDVTGSELELAAQALASNTEVRRDFERIGQWDAAIGKVMERVAIPAGLADRILVRLREGAERVSDVGLLQAGISAAIANSASEIEPVEAKYQVERAAGYDELASQRWHVRNWSRGTLTIVSVAVLLVMTGIWVQLTAEIPFDVLAQRWREGLGNKWQPVAQAPRDFPLPESMRGFSSQWQWIDRLTPTPVVAYELTHGKAGKAMLYVARLSRPELQTSPPLSPQPGSVGQAIGYWRSGDIVYVLVAPDGLRYQAFVRSSSAPLARTRPRTARPALRPPATNYRTTRKIA